MAEDFVVSAADGGRFSAYVARPEGGSGPGLVLVGSQPGLSAALCALADFYAEEGYVVLAPDLYWRVKASPAAGEDEALLLEARFDLAAGLSDLDSVVAAAKAMSGEGVGVIGFGFGGTLACLAAARGDLAVAVCHDGAGLARRLVEASRAVCRVVMHFSEADRFAPPGAITTIRAAFAGRSNIDIYAYAGVARGFADPDSSAYDRPAAAIGRSRSLAALRAALGPRYDLSELWDKHTALEFVARDAGATMATMVPAPYVNHIPTMTGGVGCEELTRFYQQHFIPKLPADTKLVPLSRTVGVDRVVDEMLFCFTHDIEVDWMLPGVAPTGKYVEIPLVAIVNFRGGKLCHEHIYWDQASVLVQIGRLDPVGLPVTGAMQARKLLDETLPSNALLKRVGADRPSP